MAQAGSYVPATSFQLRGALFDAVHVRMGAAVSQNG
jgi:DNA mismatch repair ATPase MutS